MQAYDGKLVSTHMHTIPCMCMYTHTAACIYTCMYMMESVCMHDGKHVYTYMH